MSSFHSKVKVKCEIGREEAGGCHGMLRSQQDMRSLYADSSWAGKPSRE